MRRLLTPLGLITRLRVLALVGSTALALVVAGGVAGRGGGAPAEHSGTRTAPTDVLAATISHQQKRLRDVPGDWRTWAALSASYVEKARVSADPTYYPKAEGAARESLHRKPDDNADAHI